MKIYSIRSSGNIWDNNWHAVTVTFGRDDHALWSTASGRVVSPSTRTYHIGSTAACGSGRPTAMDAAQWRGTLDEVRFYRRVLSDEEIEYLADGRPATRRRCRSPWARRT